MNRESQFDAIIIGAGHNGLVAASYLARAGQRVLMLEARDVTGGLLCTEELFPGFRGNVATNSAHSLDPRIAADMKLDDHGLRYATVEPSSITLFRGGRRVVAWQDELQVRDEIARIDHADADGYGLLLDDLGRLGEALNVSFFEEPPPFGEIASRLRSVDEQRL